jgi:hypothetical protein
VPTFLAFAFPHGRNSGRWKSGGRGFGVEVAFEKNILPGTFYREAGDFWRGRLLASRMRTERPFSKTLSSLLYANIRKFNLSAFLVYSSNLLLAATWIEIGTFLQMQHPSHPSKPILQSSNLLSLKNNHNQTLSTPEPLFKTTK